MCFSGFGFVNHPKTLNNMQISLLPPELLIVIFSFLDHTERIKVQRTSKKYYALINDETSWKSAFQLNFKRLPFGYLLFTSRLKTSWKDEYLIRVELERHWKRSIHRMLVDTRYSVDRLFIGENVEYASLRSGVIGSILKSGKTLNMKLVFEEEQSISACHITPYIYLTSNAIYVGQIDGGVIYSRKKDSKNVSWATFDSSHQDRVSCIKTMENNYNTGYIMSGSVDGVVAIWSTRTNKLVTNLTGATGRISHIEYSDQIMNINILTVFYN